MEIVKIGSLDFELQNGTMLNFEDQHSSYVDIGVRGTNRVVIFYYNADESVDYIDTAINAVSQRIIAYLEDLLQNYENLLIKIFYINEEEEPIVTVYYDAITESNDILSVIGWMYSNNDFAECKSFNVKVIDGHQTDIEF